ncbi:hypothetical protein HOE91_05820 [archaeon]|jgi:hypothetical protein|nr:hypothetical protein [archaeon]
MAKKNKLGNKKNFWKWFWIIVVILIVLGGLYCLFSNGYLGSIPKPPALPN